jgi:hypothetical protein
VLLSGSSDDQAGVSQFIGWIGDYPNGESEQWQYHNITQAMLFVMTSLEGSPSGKIINKAFERLELFGLIREILDRRWCSVGEKIIWRNILPDLRALSETAAERIAEKTKATEL